MNKVIADLVPAGSRVLDLGCGSGELLAHLQNVKGCSGYGIELDDAKLLGCAERGVNVLQLDLEQGLSMFKDQSFDVVLQLQTLQQVRHAAEMLKETVRVGRRGIVSFPNFAHWPNRLQVMAGRMPALGAARAAELRPARRRAHRHGAQLARTGGGVRHRAGVNAPPAARGMRPPVARGATSPPRAGARRAV